MRIIVCGDPDHLAVRAAEHITDRLAVLGGAVSMGLAGGSTPKPVYEILAGAQLDWSDTVLWLGDERWVDPDHPDSNSGMADRMLARHVEAEFLAFPYDSASTPEMAARSYGKQITAATQPSATRLVLLGMGEDGHTASLFPGTDALKASGVYTATWVETKDTWRMTATMEFLRTSDELVFIVSGAAKAQVLSEVVAGAEHYPAGRLVHNTSADTTFIVDAAAASAISGTSS